MTSRYAEMNVRRLRMMTSAGWMEGSLHVPKLQYLVDYVDAVGEFLRLSDARMPNASAATPFFAIQKSAISFITPLDEITANDARPFTSATKPHSVACLLEHGIVQGTIHSLVGVRLSDFLTSKSVFFPLHGCEFRSAFQLGEAAGDQFRLALVNRARMIGVSETAEA
jgi:hypothetical protein